MATSPKDQAYNAQLQKLTFLVVDPSPARNAIRGLLSQINIKPGQVQIVENLGDVTTVIQKHKPNVLFMDSALMGEQAVLFRDAQKAVVTQGAPRVLFILTSGDANTGNYDPIEEDIDALIPKPFSTEDLKKTVTTTLKDKISPTPFMRLLAEGKQLLQLGQNENALVKFAQAKALESVRVEGCYYLGLTLFRLGKIEAARKELSACHTTFPNHYPTLAVLLDVYMREDNMSEAYQIGRRIVSRHPIPIKRIPELVKLSVLNSSFDDIVGLYKVAESIQTPEVAMHLASALVVSGLHYIKNNKRDAGVDAFRKAEIVAKGNSRIVKRILLSLIRQGYTADVKGFMSRAPIDIQNSNEIQLAELDYLLEQEDKTPALDFAISLSQKNFMDPKVYHTAIELSIALRRKAIATKGIISIAARNYPDLEKTFRAYEAKLPAE